MYKIYLQLHSIVALLTDKQHEQKHDVKTGSVCFFLFARFVKEILKINY